jgi:hypothetical protein
MSKRHVGFQNWQQKPPSFLSNEKIGMGVKPLAGCALARRRATGRDTGQLAGDGAAGAADLAVG